MPTGDFNVSLAAYVASNGSALAVTTAVELGGAYASLQADNAALAEANERLAADNASLRADFMAEVDAWKAECTRVRILAGLDPHDFGDAVETIELEIKPAAQPLSVGCIAPGESVSWSADQFAPTDWSDVFSNRTLRDPMVDVVSVDTAFVVEDPAMEYAASAAAAQVQSALGRVLDGTPQPIAGHGVGAEPAAPVDPRAVALARAFKL